MSDLKTGAHLAEICGPEAVDELRVAVSGRILLPDEPGYDDARAIFNGMFDRRPAAIVQCAGAADVIDAVNFAREKEILLSVRGGGHNVAASAVCEGGLVIDLSPMKGIQVEPEARRVRAQGGVVWGELDRETQTFGLATAGGNITSTGIAGLTLGGGMGHLRSRIGLSCDNAVSFDVVTADGAFRHASATENPDLFWALRGGGGNFGVVTNFEFQLHEVGPTVYLCAPFYPVAAAKKAFRSWREFAASAPDAISTTAALWTIPPIEAFPPELHGERVIILLAVHSGDLDRAPADTQPLRAVDEPLLDMTGPMPYRSVQAMFDPFFPRGGRYYFKSCRLAELDDPAIDYVLERFESRPSPMTLVPIWHQGGAVRRVAAGETAYGDRSAPFLLSIDAAWTDPGDDEANLSWARSFWDDSAPYSTGGLYINFGGFGEEKEGLVRAAYGDNYDRLVEIKRKYDPANLFRANQNIRP